jgi:hypothetical protein
MLGVHQGLGRLPRRGRPANFLFHRSRLAAPRPQVARCRVSFSRSRASLP